MANPTKRDSAANKVVSAARAIVTYQIGLPAGCKRLNGALGSLTPYEDSLPSVTREYLNAVTGLPLGSERLEWDRKILEDKDIVLESINRQFRDRVFAACWDLIDRFQ